MARGHAVAWPILPGMEDPILRRIRCADSAALRRACLRILDAPWVDGCIVDLPNLLLEVRASDPGRRRDALETRLAGVERLARGE